MQPRFSAHHSIKFGISERLKIMKSFSQWLWETAKEVHDFPQCSHPLFPQTGPQLQKKNQIKFCYVSAQASKSSVSKTRGIASDSKLGPQAKFPQWCETWVSSADWAKPHQLHLKSSDRHFLFTDAVEEKSSSLFTRSSACLYKALHHCNLDDLMRKTWNLK